MNSSIGEFSGISVIFALKLAIMMINLVKMQFKKACVDKPSGVERPEMQKLFQCLFILL